ncbi:MAG: ribosomal protein S18-alanine N-acetyltransferase [Burkholderiales bacterium]
MSAQLEYLPAFRRMTVDDFDAVVAVEREIYPYPWTRGNFVDALNAGYHCWILECAAFLAGYAVVTVAAGESHLLNLSIAAPWQRCGLGRELLRFNMGIAYDYGARRMFLEVRPSNPRAIAIYARAGFRQIGVRRGYYPAGEGREDAVVMERMLPVT